MNTLQIDHYGYNNPYTKKVYSGCYAADLLPKTKIERKNLPQAFIVNLCDSSRSDDFCHWVALFISKDRTIEYFDSGGTNSFSSNKHLNRFILRQKPKTILYTNKRIQSYTSSHCGIFCLLFLYAKSVGVSMKKFLGIFKTKTDLQRNDEIGNKLFYCAFTQQNPNCIKKQK